MQQRQCRLRALRSSSHLSFFALVSAVLGILLNERTNEIASRRSRRGSRSDRIRIDGDTTVAFQKPLRKVHSENQPLRGEDWRARFYVNNPLGSFFYHYSFVGELSVSEENGHFCAVVKNVIFPCSFALSL